MKHIKLFEELTKDDVDFGDFVIVNSDYSEKNIQDFLSTHIGKVIFFDDESIDVEYGELTPFPHSWVFTYDEVQHWSKNRKDLEDILKEKKYNL